jgi:hypothetical protein
MNNMRAELIAPCGMNCRLCMAYQREKKNCTGCNGDSCTKPVYCVRCVIKNCDIIQNSNSGLCYECDKYPCRRLKQLDKRYRTKYHMSMIENLENIKQNGMQAFLQNEETRWTCMECGNIVSVHREACLVCKTQHNITE